MQKPAPLKPRGRSASPQRSTDDDWDAPSDDWAAPESSAEPVSAQARLADPVGATEIIETEPKKRSASEAPIKRDIPPPSKRRILAQEAKEYSLPVGAPACNDLDSAAKEGTSHSDISV